MDKLKTQEKLALMKEVKKSIVDYLEDQQRINVDALKAYESDMPIQESDVEIRKMRENEAIKLRSIIYEMNRHIAVIKKM